MPSSRPLDGTHPPAVTAAIGVHDTLSAPGVSRSARLEVGPRIAGHRTAGMRPDGSRIAYLRLKAAQNLR